MITAAAAALSATSFAKLCDIEAVADSCSVYNVKFTFKTLVAKNKCNQGAKWLVTNGGIGQAVWYRTTQAEDDAAKALAKALGFDDVRPAMYLLTSGYLRAGFRDIYWMDNATRKFEGILWQCSSDCFEGRAPVDVNPLNNGRINYAIWEKKSDTAISLPVLQAKIGIPNGAGNGFVNGEFRSIYFSRNASRDFNFLGRYGKSAQKVAAYWQPAIRFGWIDAAGFGSFDAKNLRIKSISGNAVGCISPLNVAGEDLCGNRDLFFCAVGFMCAEWRDWCCDGCYAGVELVPASGTWSVKYNASATKKANNDKATLQDFVPEYMFYATATEWEFVRTLDPFLHRDGCYWICNQTTTLDDATVIPEGALFYKEGGSLIPSEVVLDLCLDDVADKNQEVLSVAYFGTDIYKDGSLYGWVTDMYPLYDDEGAVEDYQLTIYKAAVDEAGKVTGQLATVTDEETGVTRYDIDYESKLSDFVTE